MASNNLAFSKTDTLQVDVSIGNNIDHSGMTRPIEKSLKIRLIRLIISVAEEARKVFQTQRLVWMWMYQAVEPKRQTMTR